jgi:hypothetical protein
MNPKTYIATLLLFLFSATVTYASTGNDTITMNIPEAVILTAVQNSLPIDFKLNSTTLLGRVSIDAIENLQFQQDKLSSHITLSGHDLNIVTSIAGQNLRMKIGNLTLNFQCDASIRFDAAGQTLFIRPMVTDLQSSNAKQGDIASAIVLLFNNQEFPVALDKLRPFTKDTGGKKLTIAMDIATIILQQDTLTLGITPTITATPKAPPKLQNSK